MMRESGDLLRCVFLLALRHMELEDVFCMQKFGCSNPIRDCCSFFYLHFGWKLYPPCSFRLKKRWIAHWPLQSGKPGAGANKPSAPGILPNMVFLFCMVRTTRRSIKIKESIWRKSELSEIRRHRKWVNPGKQIHGYENLPKRMFRAATLLRIAFSLSRTVLSALQTITYIVNRFNPVAAAAQFLSEGPDMHIHGTALIRQHPSPDVGIELFP